MLITANQPIERRAEKTAGLHEDFAGLDLNPGYAKVHGKASRARVVNVLQYAARDSAEHLPTAVFKYHGNSMMEVVTTQPGRLPFWHTNSTDEYLLCLEGEVRVEFMDMDTGEHCGCAVIRKGDLLLQPKEVAHRTFHDVRGICLLVGAEFKISPEDPAITFPEPSEDIRYARRGP